MEGGVGGVEYSFADHRLARAVESERLLRREEGPERAKKILQRLAQLRVAESAADLKLMPGRFHELSADRKGQFALDLDHPYRLIFEPDKLSEDDTSDIDLATVTRVVVIEIADYH